MCFAQSPPPVPAARPAPTRSDVQDAAQRQRIFASEQQSTYGNVFTSVLGDSTYGQNTGGMPKLAKLGA